MSSDEDTDEDSDEEKENNSNINEATDLDKFDYNVESDAESNGSETSNENGEWFKKPLYYAKYCILLFLLIKRIKSRLYNIYRH